MLEVNDTTDAQLKVAPDYNPYMPERLIVERRVFRRTFPAAGVLSATESTVCSTRSSRSRTGRGTWVTERSCAARGFNLGRLRYGTLAESTINDWWWDAAAGVLEVRLPWGLLNVSDPSTAKILFESDVQLALHPPDTGKGVGTRRTSVRRLSLRGRRYAPGSRHPRDDPEARRIRQLAALGVHDVEMEDVGRANLPLAPEAGVRLAAKAVGHAVRVRAATAGDTGGAAQRWRRSRFAPSTLCRAGRRGRFALENGAHLRGRRGIPARTRDRPLLGARQRACGAHARLGKRTPIRRSCCCATRGCACRTIRTSATPKRSTSRGESISTTAIIEVRLADRNQPGPRLRTRGARAHALVGRQAPRRGNGVS